MYAIVKADISEHDNVTKRHCNVITIWRTSGIEVTALLKKSTLRNERNARKEFIIGVRG